MDSCGLRDPLGIRFCGDLEATGRFDRKVCFLHTTGLLAAQVPGDLCDPRLALGRRFAHGQMWMGLTDLKHGDKPFDLLKWVAAHSADSAALHPPARKLILGMLAARCDLGTRKQTVWGAIAYGNSCRMMHLPFYMQIALQTI